MDLMTPDHPRWQEFLTRLAGQEGCFFRKTEDGMLRWDCQHGRDKRKAQLLLFAMGDLDVPNSLAWLENHGAACDCEILFTFFQKQEPPRRKRGRKPRKRWQRSNRTRQNDLFNIRKYMKASQSQLAILLGYEGAHPARYVGRIERGERRMPDGLLEKAYAVLEEYKQQKKTAIRDVTPHMLIARGEPPYPQTHPYTPREKARTHETCEPHYSTDRDVL